MSPATFAHLVHSLQAFAGGRVLALLEGGYFLPSLAGDNEDHHRHQSEKRPQWGLLTISNCRERRSHLAAVVGQLHLPKDSSSGRVGLFGDGGVHQVFEHGKVAQPFLINKPQWLRRPSWCWYWINLGLFHPKSSLWNKNQDNIWSSKSEIH